MAKVVVEGACWRWVGARDRKGYGRYWTDGGVQYAHLHAWRVIVGDIPPRAQIARRCATPGCVNPAHWARRC